MNLSLVIPVYNEAGGVEETARGLRCVLAYLRQSHQVELILVDDGSRDRTAELLRAAFNGDPHAHVICHQRNQGIGAALRTGFQHAAGDIIITTDFDGTYAFSLIPQLLAKMQVDNADIATASPYHPNGSVQGTMLLGRAASLLYRVLVNRRVHSWTSMFCAYRREVVEKLSLHEDGALASTELLVKASLRRYRVSEIPVHLRRRTAGRSRVNTLRLLVMHVRYLARLMPVAFAARITHLRPVYRAAPRPVPAFKD